MSNKRSEMRRKTKAIEKSSKIYNITGQALVGMQDEAYEKGVEDGCRRALILLLTLPLEVLMDHYWPKSYVERLPKFTNYLLEYYEQWQNGELDLDELRQDLWEYGGVKFEESE